MTQSYTPNSDASKLLSDAEAQTVVDTVIKFCGTEGRLRIRVSSQWNGGQRWARNRAALTSDLRDVRVMIRRELRGAISSVVLNQIDTDSLRGASQFVNDNMAKYAITAWARDMAVEAAHWEAKGIPVWSDKTFDRSANENGRTVNVITERAEAQGFLSAGYLETAGAQVLAYERDVWGRAQTQKGRATQGQCSITVRHPNGTGSGWAGGSAFNFERIDAAAIATLAFDKCLASLNPVRIEPGRYQTILEPAAVASFAKIFMDAADRIQAENPHPLWMGMDDALQRQRSKLGLRIMDNRLNVSHDPEDPLSGTHPAEGMRRVQIVQNGVLSSLLYEGLYSISELDQREYDAKRQSFVMQATETTSMEEMIATMKRGLLVTRVSTPQVLDRASLLCTGFTRDGLWLVENGKISKAVRNFRWTESPLFIFNNVEAISTSVPVFSPTAGRFLFGGSFQDAVTPVVVPALKVNDFSFTSTIDAV